MKPFAEVRCNFYSEILKVWFVDAWRTDRDDEEGQVVATIDPDCFEVTYRRKAYKDDPLVREVIKDKLRELLKQ